MDDSRSFRMLANLGELMSGIAFANAESVEYAEGQILGVDTLNRVAATVLIKCGNHPLRTEKPELRRIERGYQCEIGA